MYDLEPATRALAAVVERVGDDQLTDATPCKDMPVAALLDHIAGLSMAFTAAANKQRLDASAGTRVDASALDPKWREHLPAALSGLAGAWGDDAAWNGMTAAGGIDLPGEVAGAIALDEVIVHGWDLAVATGQTFTCPPELVEAAQTFVEGAVAENPGGSPGLFGPPVPVPDDAPPLDRLIGLTGRDPSWRPPG